MAMAIAHVNKMIVRCFRGYMRRFKKRGRHHGDVVYLITASWFNEWKVHTSYEVQTDTRTHTHTYTQTAICILGQGSTVNLTYTVQDGVASVSNGPSLTHKKSKRKKKKVKGHHQGPSSMSLCPPSTSQQQQTHTEVIEQGEDVLEVINIGEWY